MKRQILLNFVLAIFLITGCRVITKSDTKTYSALTDINTEVISLIDKQINKIDFKEDTKKLESIIATTDDLLQYEETKGELNTSTVKEIKAFKTLLVLWLGEIKKEKEKNVKYYLEKQADAIKKQINNAIENEKKKGA